MSRPFWQLIYIQFMEFFREPGTLFWSFFFPIVMAWGLGIAFTTRIETTRNVALIASHTSFVDSIKKLADPAKNSTDTLLTLSLGNKKSGIVHYRFHNADWQSAPLMLKRGAISMIIEEKVGKPIYHFDPFNSEGQLAYLQLEPMISHKDNIYERGEISIIKQKGIRYIDFLIPGMLAVNLMMSVMWGISYTMIERRSKKLLRRMVATPMKKSEYLYAQFAARFILCVLEAIIIMAFAYYYFGITVEGSWIALILLFIAGFMTFSGISVLISSRTSNTYIGNGLINVVVMPMMLLSGIYFSYHNFPDVVIPYIQLLPLTILADHLRAIFIEGTGLIESAKAIAALAGLGVITFIGGLKIYKWY